jgi:hypothetical protein
MKAKSLRTKYFCLFSERIAARANSKKGMSKQVNIQLNPKYDSNFHQNLD